MIKPSVNLQELRRRIYRKAKAELAGRGGVAGCGSVTVLPVHRHIALCGEGLRKAR